jgi:predicted nucleotidyltransferase
MIAIMNSQLRHEFEAKQGDLALLCEKYGVTSLDLFGSGTTDEWRPADSDLDFVVAFRGDTGPGIADRYLGLAEDLEALFGRSVDLITPASIRNPYFRERVEATRARIYAE